MADKKKKQYTNEGMDKSYRRLYSIVKPLFMLLFPEGTRVKNVDENAGKTGAIMLAARTGTPILPCYCQKRKFPFQRTSIVFGTPYMIEGPEGQKVPSSEYHQYAEDLMHRIYALKDEIE